MSKDADATTAGDLVLVTGAAGVIGSAIAIAFAKEGRDLLLHDYASVEKTETAVKAANANISVSSVTGDILNTAFVGQLFDALGSRRIQVLAHAGGVDPSRKDKEHIFEASFTAVKKLVETLTPRMVNGGVIILVASPEGTLANNMLVDFGAKRHAKGSWSPTVWLLGNTESTSYAVSKRCIQLYTKQKAPELSSLGVRIVSVSPGLIEQGASEAYTTIPEHAPMNRSGRPEEVASVVVFLASSGATYITGTDIAVDGGLGSQRWKVTKDTNAPVATSRLEKLQQKNAERTRAAHAKAQALVTKEVPPAPTNADSSTEAQKENVAKADPSTTGVAAQPSVLSTLGSIRTRFAKIQHGGLGGSRPEQRAPAREKPTETVASAEAAAAEAPTADKEALVTEREPLGTKQGTASIDREAAAVDGEAPAPEKEAPAPEKEAPAPEKEAPAPEKEAPAPEKEAPAADKAAAAVEGEAPAADKVAPAADKEAPKEATVAEGEPVAAEVGALAAKGTTQESAEVLKEPDATTNESGQGETAVVAAVEGSKAEGKVDDAAPAKSAVDEGQSAEKGAAPTNGQPAKVGGSKSTLGSLRSRLDKIQQDSIMRAKEGHRSGASKGEQPGAGLKSVLGSVRAKLDQIQQESVERVKNPQKATTATATDGELAKGQSLKSSVGTLRAKVKEMQEKNAARAKASSTNGAQKPSTGIFQPATETAGEAPPTVPEAKQA